MIKIIDKISYLPNSPKSSILNENAIYNEAFKAIVEEIRKKMRAIDTGGKSATVTVSGKVVKNNTSVNVNVSDCDDDDLLKRIEKVLH